MKKVKFSYKTKIRLVKKYLEGKSSIRKIAETINVHNSTVSKWILIYKTQGAKGLDERQKNKIWDNETKLAAVTDYINGKGSLTAICAKYKISTQSILERWIKIYNSHGNFESRNRGGNGTMTKGRKTTYEERVEIVEFCIAQGKNYELTIEKYKVSYQQIYLWVKKYKEKGIEGLKDRRGKAKPESEYTEIDKLKIKNRMLEAEKQELEMELKILKKLQEVERRRG